MFPRIWSDRTRENGFPLTGSRIRWDTVNKGSWTSKWKDEPDSSKKEKISMKSSILRDLWVLTLFMQLP